MQMGTGSALLTVFFFLCGIIVFSFCLVLILFCVSLIIFFPFGLFTFILTAGPLQLRDRSSPEIPHASRTNLRVPARICGFDGGAVCSKNSTFGYFDRTAWTLRLRSSFPIKAPALGYQSFPRSKIFTFFRII